MARLRITVTFDPPVGVDVEGAALAELAGTLRDTLADDQQLTRSAALSLPGQVGQASGMAPVPVGGNGRAPDRIFTLRMSDGDTVHGFLRALGGWLMAHPAATIAVKADGPGGGVSLRLSGWSAVAFAGAVARIEEHLRTADR